MVESNECKKNSEQIQTDCLLIQDHQVVPQTPLMSAQVLREEEETWMDVQVSVTIFLTILINYIFAIVKYFKFKWYGKRNQLNQIMQCLLEIEFYLCNLVK